MDAEPGRVEIPRCSGGRIDGVVVTCPSKQARDADGVQKAIQGRNSGAHLHEIELGKALTVLTNTSLIAENKTKRSEADEDAIGKAEKRVMNHFSEC